MNRLQELAGINEIKVNVPSNKKVVYALCDNDGLFEELLLLLPNQIIRDDEEVTEENEEEIGADLGLNIVRYNLGDEDEYDFYLSKIEV